MSWGYNRYNCAGIPNLNDYEQAKAHYEKVVPIRGRRVECKPLGSSRRFTWYTIRKRESAKLVADNPLGEFVTSYGAMLYGSDTPNIPLTVEFYADNTIDIRLVWSCPTTMDFVSFVLGSYGRIESHRGKWYWCNKGVMGTGETKFPLTFSARYRDDEGANRFRINPDTKTLEPINPVQEVRHLAIRKQLNAIRKKYKSFIDYSCNALAIEPYLDRLELAEAGHGLNFAQMGLAGNASYHAQGSTTAQERVENRTKFFNALDNALANNNLGMQYELMVYMAVLAGQYHYRPQKYWCTGEMFTNFFSDVIKYHFRNEVFKEEAVPIGTAFVDANRKYFN